MTYFTDTTSMDIGLRNDGRRANLPTARRTSFCMHYDESIELHRLDHEEQWHGLSTSESSKKHSRAENRPGLIEARYPDDAKMEDGSAQDGVTSQSKRRPPSSSLCSDSRADEDKDTADAFRKSNCTFSSHAANAKRYYAVNAPSPFTGESAFIEELIADYSSLFDGPSERGLADKGYERTRAAPAVPKGESLDTEKHQSTVSIKALTGSQPFSRNFRKLRLDLQQPIQSICKTKDQHSPDWACRTSLAIEAEAISLRNAGRHRRDSMPRHIVEAMRSPTKTRLADGRRVQSLGPPGKKTIYARPASKHGFAYPAASRHSEGALRLERGADAALSVEELGNWGVAIRREPLKNPCVQVASPVDLNKSLPALPLQVCRQHGKE
ncbi:unnamed protein product [Alternaria alternata]